ncbi:MAG: hypothetical protein CO094_01870 [Anaerolineae bacterium CG_4_9_14_3_um_filter_57_17]|nr:PAS domain S-box protein [bacterium]NCT21449.1 PAS domain S-box protein [bacterium]OIO86599.1 MAG: hypothetical protein AUK01_02805 [Anaerolineae bacterium CG2_30_57_67]PJB68184.1 MAG: hypothetical protein CO094_01870 [Anaerolineae bacterium CG_4_9_14_3_um_filter_57_17]
MTNPDPNFLEKTRRRILWPSAAIIIAWTLINLWGFFAWADASRSNFSWGLLGHGLLWLAGLAGMAWSGQRILRYLTEQERIADELRLSEARYRHLVELSPAGIAIHQDGKIAFVNPAVLKLLGVNAPAQLVGQTMMQFVHPDSQALVRERIAHMVTSGQPAPAADEKLVRPDGSVIDVQLASAPMNFGGKPAFQVLIHDQTRQKRLERALQFIEKGVSARMGQAFFQSAVTQLASALEADVVFIGEYLPGVERVRTIAVCADGSPADNFEYDLAGAPCANVINRELCCYPSGVADLFPLDEGLRTLQVDGYLGMPLRTAERAPSGILVALYRRPISDPEFARSVVQIFASRLEVEVERDRVLRDLRESEARLEAVFKNIPFEMWVSDENGCCVMQNPVSEQYWGTLIGKFPDDAPVASETQRMWHTKNLSVLSGQVVRMTQTIQREQQMLYMECIMAPIHVEEKITGLVGVNIDITDRHNTELQLREALNALQESQARLNAIFENIPFDLWLADTHGVTILQNPVSLAIWGKNIGKHIIDMNAPEELKTQWLENNRRVLAGETIRHIQRVERNRQVYHFESFQSPIRAGNEIVGYVGANIDITRQKMSEQKIQQSLRHLTMLREIDQTILAGQELRNVMETLCRQIAQLLQVDGVEILQYDLVTLRLEILARHGLRAYSAFGSFSVQEDIASAAVLNMDSVYERNFPAYLKTFPTCAELESEKFQTYAVLPLIAKGSVRGVLEIFQRVDRALDSEWWELAQTVANQAALALDNFTLFHSLQRSNAELSLSYDLTLEGWSKALELRDYETEGHTQRVTNLTVRLAEFMNVPREQLIHIRRGALLHDIGKIGIPDAILHKPGPLTEAEWEIVRQHPRFAYEMLFPIPFLHPALEIPHYHHERWSGSGYPEGRKGKDIPLPARIFAVVDVWDALISPRPYHQAISHAEAFEYLCQNSEIQFDPEIVAAFLKMMKRP